VLVLLLLVLCRTATSGSTTLDVAPPPRDLLHLIENTFDRKRIYTNPNSYPPPPRQLKATHSG